MEELAQLPLGNGQHAVHASPPAFLAAMPRVVGDDIIQRGGFHRDRAELHPRLDGSLDQFRDALRFILGAEV